MFDIVDVGDLMPIDEESDEPIEEMEPPCFPGNSLRRLLLRLTGASPMLLALASLTASPAILSVTFIGG